MRTFYVLILLISLVINAVFLYRLNKKNGGVSIASGALFSLIFYFHIIPLLIYTGIASDDNNAFIKIILDAELSQVIKAVILISIFSFCIYIFGANKLVLREKNNETELIEKKANGLLKFFALFTFIVGGVSFLFYVMSFGGFQQMLHNSAHIRSFSIDSTKYIDGLNALLIVPTRLILAAPILLFAVCRSENKKAYKVFFVFSIVLAAMFLLFNSGKTQIVQFVVPFAVIVLSKNLKHPWTFAMVVGLLSLPLLGVFDSVFYYFGYGKWELQELNLSSYVESFAYPFANLLNIDTTLELSGFQFFSIVPMSIAGLMPGMNYVPSYTYTSMLYNGVNWETKFGVPADILSVGYMQCGFVGVMFVGSLIGILSSAINQRYVVLKEKRKAYEPIMIAVTSLMFTFVVDADLGAMLKGTYLLYIGCICLLLSCIRKTTLGYREKDALIMRGEI